MYKSPMRLDLTLAAYGSDLHPMASKEPDCLGVEVELEGKNVMAAGFDVLAYWKPHADNSLRNFNGGQCIEYVSKMPYNMEDTIKSIDVLYKFLTDPEVKVHDSYRTSIHVHLNFGLETFRTIYNFITLSLIVDELLVSQNGDHRIGNNFCLRAKDAVGQVDNLIWSIQKGSDIFGINMHDRYSSINFASLMKFGSIEFRSLECTVNKGRLIHWINTLSHMKKVSREFTNPIEIISKFSQLGPQGFLFYIFGPYALKYVAVPGYEGMLKTGMRLAQDFAYCSEWKAMAKEELTKPKAKMKKAPKMFEWPDEAAPAVNYDQLLNQLINPGAVDAPQPIAVQPIHVQAEPVEFFEDFDDDWVHHDDEDDDI